MVSELKCIDSGHGYSREINNPSLTRELAAIFKVEKPRCLVGIPTMDPAGDKYRKRNENGDEVGWFRHAERYCRFLQPGRTYYSALISRPDCGAWMRTPEYCRALQSIWHGKRVAVIGSEGESNKMLKAVRLTNEDVAYIECPFRQAYAAIDDLERQALESGRELIVISAGVTATCLAYRLADRVQAVDIGSVGGFILRMMGAEKWH